MLATKINNNQWLYFVFALMKCGLAAFGEQNKKCFLYSGFGILHAVGGVKMKQRFFLLKQLAFLLSEEGRHIYRPLTKEVRTLAK